MKKQLHTGVMVFIKYGCMRVLQMIWAKADVIRNVDIVLCISVST